MADFTTNDGVRIHYETEGRDDGPPLLFANSLGTDLSLWDAQAAEAAGFGFRVIRYDGRGHGQSEAPDGDYTLERLGQDALGLLDKLKVEKTAFCGISMGAMTGTWLAMNHSRRFSRVALCNTTVWMADKHPWNDRIDAVQRDGMEAVVDTVVERWFTADFRRREPDEVERVRAMILATDPDGYCGSCAAIRDVDMRDRLGLIETPTLVVIGAHDPATPPERGQYLVERIPGAQKAVLEAAHLSNVEAPAEFNRIVLGFLAGERPGEHV